MVPFTRSNMSHLSFLLLLALSLVLQGKVHSRLLRGVSLANLPFYNPSQNFSCLDGSKLLPFSSVNDDYCDCEDGSDEPGTSACSNGSFFCINAGYKGENILSNRVNDGVCDCCDGSDEYEDDITCKNTCREKGREELERLKRLREETEKGFKVKVEETEKGKAKRVESEKELTGLKSVLETQKANLEELRAGKERAEAPEKEAKDKHQKEWEAEKEKRNQEAQRKAAEEAFPNLDLNKDGKVTVQDLVANPYIDSDMSEAEAKELLGGNEEATIDVFIGLWEKIKVRYAATGRKDPALDDNKEKPQTTEDSAENLSKEDQELLKPPEPQATPDGVDDVGADKDEEDEEEEEETEEDKTNTEANKYVPSKPEAVTPKEEEEEMPDYDEETKRLMLIADEARNQYDDVQNKVKQTEKKITDLEKQLSFDFGPDEEFSGLYGQCFELNDREYTYRLCPFNEAVQAPKAGGGDTSLGSWKGWTGHPNRYTRMKYEGGVGCWNGPARSTEVILQCGPATELISASEPNRCEYLMEFKTPSLCQDPATLPHLHEEL